MSEWAEWLASAAQNPPPFNQVYWFGRIERVRVGIQPDGMIHVEQRLCRHEHLSQHTAAYCAARMKRDLER